LSTEVKEEDCRFKFDLSEVYWNSKLQKERNRVLEMLKPQDVVCDMFAGVGPFALRAAKKGCRVIANDLNPACYKYLVQNSVKNKVSSKVHAYNLDARDFMTGFLKTHREEVKCEHLLESPPMADLPSTCTHIYMNLPKDALEFLDVFVHSFDKQVWQELPIVHVYGFSAEEDAREELLNRVKQIWGEFDTSQVRITKVRDVSPKKFMYCVETKVPACVAFPQKRKGSPTEDTQSKSIKT